MEWKTKSEIFGIEWERGKERRGEEEEMKNKK